MALVGLGDLQLPHAEPPLRVELRIAFRQRPAGFGDHADTPPLPVGNREHIGQCLLGDGVAGGGDRARIGITQFGGARLEQFHHLADTLQQVQRLETGDHDGHTEPLDQRAVFAGSHHGADMAGGQETLHPVGRGAQDGRHRRRHQDVGHQH